MIRIELIGDAEVKARFQAMPERVRQALVQQIRLSWLDLQAYIVSSKLSGQVLKRRTGVLASSITAGADMSASVFEDAASQITGIVGTRVWYGAVHEYGGTFTVKAHVRKVTEVFGRPVTPTEAFVKEHTARFPERSYLRAGLQDRSDQIRADIQAALNRAMGA